MGFLSKFKRFLESLQIFKYLKEDKFFGNIALLLILLVPLLSVIWLFAIPTDIKETILLNFYFVLLISLSFAFVLNVFLIYTQEVPFLLQIAILMYVVFFALSTTIAIVHPYISLATQVLIAVPLAYRFEKGRNKFWVITLTSLSLAQFPPFPFVPADLMLIIKIATKFIILFMLLFGISFVKLPFKIRNIIPFLVLSLNFVYVSTVNFANFQENIKVLSQTLWTVITVPLWLILAGDLVDEVGRFAGFVSKRILSFLNTPVKVKAEISIVFILSLLLTVLSFLYPELVVNWFYTFPLPSFLYDYRDAFLITLRFLSLVISFVALFSIYNFDQFETLELKNRFNQILLALIVFSVQISYSYYFTNQEEVKASLTGFPFLLLVFGLFWDPIKMIGTANIQARNFSVLLAYVIILTSMAVNINLVWDPYSVSKVSIVYQVLGGILVGFPIFFFRLIKGWEYDEKFIFRSFLLGFIIGLFPMVAFPNHYWLTIPMGLILSVAFYKLVLKKEVSSWAFLMAGFGVLAQSSVGWIIPLPIFPLIQTWYNNIGQVVPIEIFSMNYFINIFVFVFVALVYLFLSKSKLHQNICLTIASIFYLLVNFILYKFQLF
ncbi:hypothetical protein D9V84_00505 [Bacteroidetes/Chlorobi group bacterium Naka2016]|jgi:hypothetical protein|nr:MAG: hypothetical protein D9V84_00505 [Bacteroidetes/Chlorobi group bacterium Naka2016]